MNQTAEGSEARFLPKVEEALRRLGWFPGRQVEEEVMQKWYAFRREDAPGYCRVFATAYRFLREFGGLRLGEGGEECLIDPLETLGIQEDMLIYNEWQVETHFYPLGVWNTGDVLHIDVQGRFWDLPAPRLLGHNTEEALTNILLPGRFWSHPPQKVELRPIDQATEELMERIVKAEQKVAPDKAMVLRNPPGGDLPPKVETT